MQPMNARTIQALIAPPGALNFEAVCSCGRLRR